MASRPEGGFTRDEATGALVVTTLAMKAARLFRAALLSIANNTLTPVAFTDERFDTSAMHDPVTNTTRLTITEAGLWLAGGNVEWASNNSGFRTVVVRKNGTTEIGHLTQQAVQSAVTRQLAVTLVELAVGDYIELCVAQNSGVALNLAASPEASPSLWAVRLSG